MGKLDTYDRGTASGDADPNEGRISADRATGRFASYLRPAAGFLVVLGLYLTSLYSVVLFHSLVELFSMVVAFSIFVIAWNSREFIRNNYVLLIGLACFFVTVFDLLHTATCTWQGGLHGFGPEQSIQFSTVGTALLALSFLIAPLFLGRTLRAEVVFGSFLVLTVLIILSILYLGGIPNIYLSKPVGSFADSVVQVGICLFFALSVLILLYKRSYFENRVLWLLVGAIVTAGGAQVALVCVSSPSSVSLLIGHYSKIASFYMLYKALVETGLRQPYAILLRELKNEKDALTASENRYRTIFEMSPASIFEADWSALKQHLDLLRDFGVTDVREYLKAHPESARAFLSTIRILDLNQSALNAIEARGREEVRLSLEKIFSQDGLPSLIEAMAALAEGRREWQGEVLLTSLSGKSISLYCKWIVAPCYEQTFSKVWGALLDISERKLAERALQESEARYRDLFENANDIVYTHDLEGNYTSANSAATRILGYSADEFVTLNFRDIVDPSYLPVTLERFIAKVADGVGRTAPYEIIVRAKDGSPVWLEISSRAILEDDRVVGIHGVARDITERKRVEEALRASEAQKQAILDGISSQIAFVNRDLRVLWANRAAAESVGKTTSELVGRSCHDCWEQSPGICMGCPAIRAFRTVKHEQSEIVGPGDTIRLVRATPVIGSDGAVSGVIIVSEDVTERRRAQEMIAQAQRLSSVGELSAGVAHHFNNMLQIVMGNLELAQLGLEAGDLLDANECLAKALESARGGAEIVRRLQSFAQALPHVLPAESTVFDLSAVVRQAVDMARPFWKTSSEKEGVKISVHLDLQDGCLVRGVEVELFEAGINLVKNAVEALTEGGDIRISTAIDERSAVLRVEDSGTGIAREHLGRVFEPFFTARGPLRTGMGLAITYGIIKRHKGQIFVDSTEGHGTIFTVKLPLAVAPPAEETVPRPIELDRKSVVLVVDDLRAVAEMIRSALTRKGHSVHVASSGAEALEIFKGNDVDLVICDLVMPGMNGWEVGQAIKEICANSGKPKTPFILMTGWRGQTLEDAQLVESGVDGIIEKPIELAKLQKIVMEASAREP